MGAVRVSAWRELSDQELFDLDAEVKERRDRLQAQGVQIYGVEEHYMRTLLEACLSERQLAAARETHLLWMRERLDEVEPEVARALTMQRLGIGQQQPAVNGAG